MTWRVRVLLFVLLGLAVGFGETWWFTVHKPDVAAPLAVAQLQPSDAAAHQLRAYETRNAWLPWAGTLTVLVALWVLILGPLATRIGEWFREGWRNYKMFMQFLKSYLSPMLLLAAAALALGGCMREYDKPEYAEIDTSETGFLIPLEGDTTQQGKFQSVEYLTQKKVAAKRVQIVHRWNQTGRWENDGHWIPSVKLIKVNRSPVTRLWTAEGTSGTSRKDEAIWVESEDSIGFSIGFSCTGFISEEDAAKFLYWYPMGSLANVMDSEVHARIQQVAGDVAAKYKLEVVRSKKQEIMDAVRQDITEFFKNRGITITTVGMYGGLHYENAKIQDAIDATVIAQQQKEVTKAEWDAQQKRNDRVTLEAEATAEKFRREAKGQADAKLLVAQAEAEGIRQINRALNESSSPLLLQVKQLDVQQAQIQRWDGRYPTYLMNVGSGGGNAPALMLQLPASAPQK